MPLVARTFITLAAIAAGLASSAAAGAQSADRQAAERSLSFPVRAAFYYPWFPEVWTVDGHPIHYSPTLGRYSNDSRKTARAHVKALDYGRFEAAIASWWGQGQKKEQTRIPLLLRAAKDLGSPLRWTLYYEEEGPDRPNPSVAKIRDDLTYIKNRYATHSSYLRVGGKFVVFVYNAGDSDCSVVDRWKAGNTVGAHIVMKVFSGWEDCPTQPNSWHQYGPSTATQEHHPHSHVISPGFFHAPESSPRLTRSLSRWRQQVAALRSAPAKWQLVTTFNEWGEGTSVESADEWKTRSGFGAYLDVLHGRDRRRPTTPGEPTLVRKTKASITFRWRRSADNVGVAGYRVYRGTSRIGTTRRNRFTARGLRCGRSYRFSVRAFDAAGNTSRRASGRLSTKRCGTPSPPPTGGKVLAGAGDIADDDFDSEKTAKLLDKIDPDVVFTTGDNAYEDGTASEYASYYHPTWGRHKAKTKPTPGNHEYNDPAGGAAGYFDYFGVPEYYAYNVGSSWRAYALNSSISTDSDSPQVRWLRSDLAANSRRCVLAYWHHPRFSAGNYSDSTDTKPFWDALYRAGAEIVLNGHDHNYQRYVPMRGDGTIDRDKGVREFVVGMGGKDNIPVVPRPDGKRKAANGDTFGVLKLTLRSGSYRWDFVPEAGRAYSDSGSRKCHGRP